MTSDRDTDEETFTPAFTTMSSHRIVTESADPKRQTPASIASWLVSVILHTATLVALGLWVLPPLAGRRVTESLQGRWVTNDDRFVELSIFRPIDRPVPTAAESSTDDEPTQIDSVPITDPRHPSLTSASIDKVATLKNRSLEQSLISLLRPTAASAMTIAQHSSAAMPRSVSSAADGIRQADGIAAAAGMVTESIGDELSQADTLVVWLLDASISLEVHRETMARRAEAYYESIGGLLKRDRSDNRNRLFSSVIGFGDRPREVLAPTPIGVKAIQAIRRVPRDTSGTENVMQAVNYAVKLYRKDRHRRERMILVVLTDEAGDDALMLESSIRKCREAQVAIHVIAATSVMGIQQGIQHCVIKQNDVNYSFWLDVKKGPESFRPQRFYVPYWHESTLPPWKSANARAVENAQWFGGPYRERVLSGFGPYALTRLALQTGGTMTLFDHRAGARGHYDIQTLRPYTPDYGPTNQYLSSVGDSPIRRFVSEAAELSFHYPELFVPPRMTFIGVRSVVYPYDVRHQYFPPAEFRRRMNAALETERDRVEAARSKLTELMRRFGDAKIDWTDEYEHEESRRWQAWYDLTKGRLLSTVARYDEYLAATRDGASSLGSRTNAVMLLPTDSMRMATSPQTIDEAKFYLHRCIDQNPSTPWESLARWELEKPWGIRIEPTVVPPPTERALTQQMQTEPEQIFAFPRL